MNFAALATAVGQRAGVDTSSPSTRDGAAVRSFLTLRHDQLYRAFLWKDAILEFDLTLGAAYTPLSNYMPTKGHVILPPIIQHVLGVRLGCRALNIQRPMLYYRANYGEFFNSGYAADFQLLSSCVWEFDTVQTLALNTANAADNTQIATLDILAADEVTVSRIMPMTSVPNSVQFSTDRIDNFIKPTTNGTVAIGCNPTNVTTLTPVSVAGTNYSFVGGLTFQAVLNGLTVGATYQFTPGVKENGGSFANGTQSFNGLVTGVIVTFVAQQTSILIVQNNGLGGQITPVINQAVTVTNYTPLVTLQPTDQAAPKSARFQLIGNPTNTTQSNQTLFVLGKRNTPPFSAETDVPGINGLDGVLFSLAYYDFKQRDEYGGTPDAQAALNEAVGPNFMNSGKPGGFLGKLIEEEVIQAAYNCRIIPSHGFGGDQYYNQPWDKAWPYGGDW